MDIAEPLHLMPWVPKMRRIRVFISSPGDVVFEREIVERTLLHINTELSEDVQFEPMRWEKRVYEAYDTFQNLIPEASSFDIVIGIFRQRLGSPLPIQFPPMPPEAPYDGERYPSGSAYEVLSAIRARESWDPRSQMPPSAVYVFRLRSEAQPPMARIDDERQLKSALVQWDALEAFFTRFFKNASGEFLRAFHTYTNQATFAEQIEKLLRQWIVDNLSKAQQVIWPVELKGSPFRGLQPFDAKQSSVYFGRDRKVARALQALLAQADDAGFPFLFIMGASGAGKSSLMRAGLAPRLTRPGHVPGVAGWRTAVVRIGDADPFSALAEALLVSSGGADPGGFGAALPEIAATGYGMTDDLAALLATVEPAMAPIRKVLDDLTAASGAKVGSARPDPVNLLLLLDQFESLFTADLAPDRRDAFARLLIALCRTRRVWIAATFRADQYENLVKPGPFIALKDRSAVYDLAAPGPSELAEIIQKSAAAAGLAYEKGEDGESLDDLLLHDAMRENSLPMLQFALDQLYRESVRRGIPVKGADLVLTYGDYRNMGGLDGALDKAAEDALRPFDEAAIAAILPRLLRRLIVRLPTTTSLGAQSGALTTRPATKASLGWSDPAARMTSALIDARIMVAFDVERDKVSVGMVALAHQGILLNWRRLESLVKTEDDYFRVREEVESGVARWRSGKRRAELALSTSPRLSTAAKLIRDHPDEFDPDIRDYVAASLRKARLRQGAGWAVAAVTSSLALGTGFFAVESYRNLAVARANYEAARGTIDNLVGEITGQLQNASGVRQKTVGKAFKVIDGAILTLKRTSSSADASLERTRAKMLFSFATVYQKSGQEDLRAATSDESIRIRADLLAVSPSAADDTGYDARPEDLWQEFARSLDQRGDILRRPSPEAAIQNYNRSLRIRRHFAGAGLKPERAIALSMSLIRLGDLANDKAQAWKYYMDALTTTSGLYLTEATPDLRREVGWSLGKLGDVAMSLRRPADAVSFFGDAACLRRVSVAAELDDDLLKQDLAFSLERLGRAESEADRPQAHDDLIEAFMVRDELVRSDRGNFVFGLDKVQTLIAIADHYKRRHVLRQQLEDEKAAQALLDDLRSHAGGELQKPDRNRADALAAALSDRLAQAQKAVDDDPVAAQPTERWVAPDAEITILQRARGTAPVSPGDCLTAVERHIRSAADQVGTIVPPPP